MKYKYANLRFICHQKKAPIGTNSHGLFWPRNELFNLILSMSQAASSYHFLNSKYSQESKEYVHGADSVLSPNLKPEFWRRKVTI